jgi:hypothetical protein
MGPDKFTGENAAGGRRAKMFFPGGIPDFPFALCFLNPFWR